MKIKVACTRNASRPPCGDLKPVCAGERFSLASSLLLLSASGGAELWRHSCSIPRCFHGSVWSPFFPRAAAERSPLTGGPGLRRVNSEFTRLAISHLPKSPRIHCRLCLLPSSLLPSFPFVPPRSAGIAVGFYGNGETCDGVNRLTYSLRHANRTITGVQKLVGLKA